MAGSHSKPNLTLIARADNTGLGNQTWELYRHLKPSKTYIIDLTTINAQIGKKTELHLERYPDGRVLEGPPTKVMIEEILSGTDVLLTVETPYNYELFERAKAKGIKTILQYNYEFLDYLQIPGLPQPDLLLAPSTWHLEDVKGRFDANVEYLPVPTNRHVLPFRERTTAKHFVHVAGHPTFMDRNGTAVVLEAMQYVKSPIQLTIYSQFPIESYFDERITLKHLDIENYWTIYNQKDYDILLLPRRYGGLSLQLNESLSVGMPVVMTDVEPQNSFMPKQLLIEPLGADTIHTRTEIECYKPSQQALARKIDELYREPRLVNNLSKWANRYAETTSWHTLKPKYDNLIKNLCQTN